VCGASQEPNGCNAGAPPACPPPGCVAATSSVAECFNCN
jgi:hypothetical protein